MKFLLLVFVTLVSFSSFAQEEGDSVLRRCPVYITDTVSSNNFFLEFQPSTLKVYRSKGNLTVVVDQRDQFFTLFFNVKKLDDKKYKIVKGSRKKSYVEAKYSFRSGDQASYVDVSKGTVESTLDKARGLWHLKVNGLMANFVGRSVSYYKVKADLYLKD